MTERATPISLSLAKCEMEYTVHLVFMLHEVRIKNQTMFINFIWFHDNFNTHGDSTMKYVIINKVRRRLYCFTRVE